MPNDPIFWDGFFAGAFVSLVVCVAALILFLAHYVNQTISALKTVCAVPVTSVAEPKTVPNPNGMMDGWKS